MKEIYLAGGCFWGMQKFLDGADGVIQTRVGYANGPFLHPAYSDVKHGSGHAETCKVIYDETVLPLGELLARFLEVIDPFAVNKQGEDEGIQYRTGIYYTDEADVATIREEIAAVEAKAGKRCAVEVLPLNNFSLAEEYHQKYLEKNPEGYCHIKCAFKR